MKKNVRNREVRIYITVHSHKVTHCAPDFHFLSPIWRNQLLWIFLLQPSTIQHLSLVCADWCGSDNTKVLSTIWRGHLAKAKRMETSPFLWRKSKQVMWGSIFSGSFDFTVNALKHFGHYNFSLVLLVLTDPSWVCHFCSPCLVGECVRYLSLPLRVHSLLFSDMLCPCLLDSEGTLDFASK